MMEAPMNRALAQSDQLKDYVLLKDACEGDGRLFESVNQGRWVVRTLGRELAQAQALAIVAGRLRVHPTRARLVIERDAIAKAQRRFGGQ